MSLKPKILITGANGQLGKEFQRYLTAQKIDFAAYNKAELDISNANRINEVLEKNSPEILINCAAYTDVEKAESDFENCNAINTSALKTLGKSCENLRIKVLHFSTDYVFDGSGESAYSESDETSPINIYGITKRNGELELINETRKSLVIRVSWLYSEFGSNFPLKINQLLKERDELKIVNDQISSPTWAKPLVKFVVDSVINADDFFSQQILHLSEDGEGSWYDMAQIINEKHNKNIIPVGTDEFETKALRPAYSKLDSDKAKKQLKYSPKNWKENLREFLKIIQD